MCTGPGGCRIGVPRDRPSAGLSERPPARPDPSRSTFTIFFRTIRPTMAGFQPWGASANGPGMGGAIVFGGAALLLVCAHGPGLPSDHRGRQRRRQAPRRGRATRTRDSAAARLGSTRRPAAARSADPPRPPEPPVPGDRDRGGELTLALALGPGGGYSNRDIPPPETRDDRPIPSHRSVQTRLPLARQRLITTASIRASCPSGRRSRSTSTSPAASTT